MAKLVDAFDYDWDDLQWLTVNAMKSAFWPFDRRLRLIDEVIKPGFAAVRRADMGYSEGEVGPAPTHQHQS